MQVQFSDNDGKQQVGQVVQHTRVTTESGETLWYLIRYQAGIFYHYINRKAKEVKVIRKKR